MLLIRRLRDAGRDERRHVASRSDRDRAHHRQVVRVGRSQLGSEQRSVTSLRMAGQNDGVAFIGTDELARRARRVEHRTALALADEVRMRPGGAEPVVVGRDDHESILGPPRHEDGIDRLRPVARWRVAVEEAGRAVRPAQILMRAGTRLLRSGDHAADGDRLTVEANRPIEHRPDPHAIKRAADLLRADDVARFAVTKRRRWLVEVRDPRPPPGAGSASAQRSGSERSRTRPMEERRRQSRRARSAGRRSVRSGPSFVAVSIAVGASANLRSRGV